MPSNRRHASLALQCLLLVSLSSAGAVAAEAPSGPGGETPLGGSSPMPDNLLVPSEYATIQAAVDAAVNGEVIVVAGGFYSENVIIDAKAVTIYASGTVWIWPAVNEPVFTIEHTPDEQFVTLQGLVIRDPDDIDLGMPMPSDDDSESYTTACGLYATYASVYVTDCQFVGLQTSGDASMLSHANGGAISARSSNIVLHRSTVQSCESTWGGAVWVYGGSFEATQCLFRGNDAEQGGGLYLFNVESSLEQCELAYNEATVDGSQLGVCGGTLDMKRCRLSGDLATGSAVRANAWYMGTFGFAPTITVANCRFETGDSTEYTYVWYQDAGDGPSLATSTFCDLHRCAGVVESDSELAMLESCDACAADVNFDGVTNMDDLMDVLLQWGDADPFTDLLYESGSSMPPLFDVGVGETDAWDLSLVVTYFGTCG